jgi:hypothetical protein
MKTTLRTTAFLLCLLNLSSLRAQLTVFAGPQVTTAKYRIQDVSQKTEHKQGFAAGIGLKSLIEGPVYFSPLLFYTQKGYKVKFNRPAAPPDSGAVNNNATLHAVELAPLIQINFSKGASYPFLRIGPSFDINLSGTETFDSSNGKRKTRDMPFSFGDYGFVTVALNGQVGFQHKNGLSLFAYYNYGVSSLNNADNGPAIFHRVAGVAAGWRFGRKR